MVRRYVSVFTYCGPAIEFSRKSFIEERSSPWYSRISWGVKTVGVGVKVGEEDGEGVEEAEGVGLGDDEGCSVGVGEGDGDDEG